MPRDDRARMRATRALFIRHGAEATPEGRSLRLLRDWLSPAQQEQFASKGYFEVVGSDSGKRYRIHAGASANVCEIDERGRLQGGGVSCRSAFCRSETSCSPRRSCWKHARARCAPWPGGSLQTVSISGKPDLWADGADRVVAAGGAAIERGWLWMHESGAYVKCTPAGAELFA